MIRGFALGDLQRVINNRGESPKLEKILDAFDYGNKILDVGCNVWSILKRISDKLGVRDAFGLDISDDAVNTADKYKNLKISKCNFDRDGLPFEDACFYGDVNEHLFDPDHLIMEVYRVLKTGGYAVFTTPNLASWYNRISLLLEWQPGWTEISTRYIVGHPVRKRRILKKIVPIGPSLGVYNQCTDRITMYI